MKRSTIAWLLGLTPVLTGSAVAAEPEERTGSPGQKARLFAFVRPGEGYTADAIARAAVARSPRAMAAAARAGAARSRVAEAQAGFLPRTRLAARYTRLSEIDNDPLVPLTIDLDAARQGVAQIADPAAQAVLGAQLDQLAGLANASIEIPQDQYALSAEASYPVSQAFLEILPGLRATEAAAEASAAEVEVAKNIVALEAIEAFLGHARARSALEVAELAVAQARTNLEAAKARLEAKTGTRPDVLRLAARLAEAERVRAERRAEVAASAAAVRTLAGLEGAGPLDVGEPLLAPPAVLSLETGDVVAEAWARRDELSAVEALARARAAAAAAEVGAVLPRLLASARFDYANPNLLFVPPGDEFRTSWSLSAVLEWSPDGAFAASRRAEAASRDATAVLAERDALRDLVRIEVTGAQARVVAGREALLAAERGLEAAEEAHAAVQRGYELGVFDATDLINAELQLEEARLGLVDAGIELRVRQARLRRSAGDDLFR